MKLYAIILFFLSYNLYCQNKVIDDSTGIIIEFVSDNTTFPESWKTNTINATGVSLDSSEIERSIRIVKTALKKYPKSVLTRNLKKVIVLKSIKFYGQKYGGTNSTSIVYIANNGVSNNYTDYYLEKSFHHEFSSILLRNYAKNFDEKKWQSFNKMPYGQGGVSALENKKAGQTFDSTLNANGFLHEYGTSDQENDFNSFAENIFIPNHGFWKITERYPDINEKLNMIIVFYGIINPVFNRNYFETFNKETTDAK